MFPPPVLTQKSNDQISERTKYSPRNVCRDVSLENTCISDLKLCEKNEQIPTTTISKHKNSIRRARSDFNVILNNNDLIQSNQVSLLNNSNRLNKKSKSMENNLNKILPIVDSEDTLIVQKNEPNPVIKSVRFLILL